VTSATLPLGRQRCRSVGVSTPTFVRGTSERRAYDRNGREDVALDEVRVEPQHAHAVRRREVAIAREAVLALPTMDAAVDRGSRRRSLSAPSRGVLEGHSPSNVTDSEPMAADEEVDHERMKRML